MTGETVYEIHRTLLVQLATIAKPADLRDVLAYTEEFRELVGSVAGAGQKARSFTLSPAIEREFEAIRTFVLALQTMQAAQELWASRSKV